MKKKEPRNQGIGIGYLTHRADRTPKWNISLNARHRVLFTGELAVCEHLHSSSITYSKKISSFCFLHSSQAWFFLKAALANTRVRNQGRNLMEI